MEQNIINANTNFGDLLKNINEGKFGEKYPSYNFWKSESGYLIYPFEINLGKDEIKDNGFNEIIDKFIFLFKIKTNIKLINKDTNETFKEFEAFSTFEIEKNISFYDIKISQLFVKTGNKFVQYKYIKNILGTYISNKILEIYIAFIKDLPKLELKEILEQRQNYRPEEYSIFFYDYFIYEDKDKREEEFIYFNNDKRNIIFNNIKILKSYNNNLKTYKITGPSSIGKSLTLFYISRILYNVIYINLKTLNNYKKNLYKCYHIIITELERLVCQQNINELEKVIKNCFEKQLSPLELILSVMKFLSNIIGLNFVFIFDQYKKKYIIEGFYNEIMNYKNIKIIFCSSINDKEIRDECIKSWERKVMNIEDFNDDSEKYYFYFDDIYSYQKRKYNNKLLKQFNFLPKYVKMYEDNNKDYKSFLEEAISKIKKKIKEYCKNDENQYYDILVHLRFIIDNEYIFSKLSEIIQYCLLKFFKIEFYERTFKITPIFSFMKYFIWIHFSEDICYNYFNNSLYRKNIIESESVKGCYFEQAVKYGLQKICKYNNIVTLREIAEMKEIIDTNSYYNIDEEDDTNENEIDICYEDDNKKNNKKFHQLLEDFKINDDENLTKSFISNKNKNLISKYTIEYSKNIEDFRMDAIKDYKYEISIKNNFTGNEALLLDQIKKTGKTLDYALLYGKKNEKVLIGFQIKCYFNNSILAEQTIDKSTIRENCSKMLVNSMILFNCKITNWNYILIFFINNEEKNENINLKNLEKCKNNNIHYLFYDPKNKVFLNENKKVINSIKLEENSDLDNFQSNILNYTNIDEIIREKGKIKIVGNLDKMIECFIEDMSLVIKTKNLSDILNMLSRIVQFKLKFSAKINIIEDGLLLPPNQKHLYIYKFKNNKLILVQREQSVNNYIEYYDIKDNKKIDLQEFLKLIGNNNGGYYYCLEKYKKINENKK